MFSRHAEWTSAFQKLSERYRGFHSGAGLFHKPSAQFSYRQHTFQVRCRRDRSTRLPKTELSLPFELGPPKLEVIRHFGASRFWGAWVLPEIPRSVKPNSMNVIGFFTNDEAKTRELLTSAVQWKIEQLCQLQPSNGIYLCISRKRLSIALPHFIKEAQVSR